MTKEAYFEMCEMLGSEPLEEEIPIEYEDLFDEIQEALSVYNMLQDNIDGMNGIYLGKVVTGIDDIFNIMEITDKKTCFYIITLIDRERSKRVNAKQDKKPPK